MTKSPPVRRRLAVVCLASSLTVMALNMGAASAATVPSSTLVPSGVSLRVGPSAVQFVGDQVINSILAQPAFNSTMVAANPMATGNVLLSTWSASGTNWKAASGTSTVTAAAANDGTLNVSGQINNITADVSAAITGLVNLNLSGKAVISNVTFTGTAKIAPGINGSVATVTVPTSRWSHMASRSPSPVFPPAWSMPSCPGSRSTSRTNSARSCGPSSPRP